MCENYVKKMLKTLAIEWLLKKVVDIVGLIEYDANYTTKIKFCREQGCVTLQRKE